MSPLTHWGRVTHICVGKLTIIGSDNGLSPERCQAIIWTNAGILLIWPLGTNFNEILIEIQTFSLKKIRLKMSSTKCCSFRLGLNVLMDCPSLIYGMRGIVFIWMLCCTSVSLLNMLYVYCNLVLKLSPPPLFPLIVLLIQIFLSCYQTNFNVNEEVNHHSLQ